MAPSCARFAAAVVVALLAPLASAAPGSLALASPEPVLLDGRVTVVAEDGSAHVYDAAARGVYLLSNVTGTLRAYTVQAMNSQTSPRLVQSLPGTLEMREYVLRDAEVVVSLAGERFELKARALDGGAVTAGGSVAAQGRPHHLAERVESEVGAGIPLFGPPERVRVAWEAGWTFVGAYAAYGGIPLDGFPAPAADATLGLEGKVHLHLVGGTVAFTDAAGERHALRTGNWSEGAGAGPEVETRRDAFFEGVVGGARIGAGPFWGVGAPAVSWRLDGDVEWRDATGTATLNGTRTTFDGATVRGRGVVVIRPDAPGLVPAAGGDVPYLAAGEWDALRVGGEPLVASRDGSAAAIAGASLLGLLLAFLLEGPRTLLLRAGLGLYTRLAPGDLLDHPQRARIHHEAQRTPGVHLRELHRRVGGGWGTFRVHLHLLRQAGHVRVEPRGGYTLVFPAASPRAAPDRPVAIPHPLARAVYDALPPDGSAVPLRALRERVGTTRQLLNYHTQRLQEEGLVRVTEAPQGRRAVSRTR